MSGEHDLHRVFDHRGSHYCYDTCSNDVYIIDQALQRALIRDSAQSRQMPSADGTDSSIRTMTEAAEEVSRLRANGKMFASGPLEVFHECADCWSPSKYDEEVSQLTLHVTERCNLSCLYCPGASARSAGLTSSVDQMPASTALRAIDYFLPRSTKARIRAISFYGGEPMLESAVLVESVRHIRTSDLGKDILITIDTNGTLLQQPALQELVRYKVHLQISLDGPEHIHDKWRVTSLGYGSHETVVDGIRRLLAADETAAHRLMFSVTVAPPYELAELAEYFNNFPPFRALSVRPNIALSVNLANLNTVPAELLRPFGDVELLKRQRLLAAQSAYLEECRDRPHERVSAVYRSLFDKSMIQFYRRDRSPLARSMGFLGACVPGVRKMHVVPNGDILPCERVARSLVIGNVERGIDFKQVALLREAYALSLRARCQDCWAVRLCDLCFAALQRRPDQDDCHWEVPLAACLSVRESKESTIRMMIDLCEMGASATSFLAVNRER